MAKLKVSEGQAVQCRGSAWEGLRPGVVIFAAGDGDCSVAVKTPVDELRELVARGELSRRAGEEDAVVFGGVHVYGTMSPEEWTAALAEAAPMTSAGIRVAAECDAATVVAGATGTRKRVRVV